MPDRVVLIAGAAFLVAAAALFAPWLARDREVVEATPTHPPLYAPLAVEVKPGGRACVRPVTLTARTEIVRFGMADDRRADIHVVLRGPGYRHTAAVQAFGPLVDAGIARPPRDMRGEVCFENVGREVARLRAHSDARILSRPETIVDGAPVPGVDIGVTLMRRGRAGYASRLGDMLARADALGPGFATPWLIAIVGLLALVVIPAGALAAAAKPEDREQERGEEDLQPDDQ